MGTALKDRLSLNVTHTHRTPEMSLGFKTYCTSLRKATRTIIFGYFTYRTKDSREKTMPFCPLMASFSLFFFKLSIAVLYKSLTCASG